MQTSETLSLAPPPAGDTTTSEPYVAYPDTNEATDFVEFTCAAGDVLVCSGSLLVSTSAGTGYLAIRVTDPADAVTTGGAKTTSSSTPTLLSPFHRHTCVTAGVYRVRFAIKTTAGTLTVTEGPANYLQVTRWYEYVAAAATPAATAPVYDYGDAVPTSGIYRPGNAPVTSGVTSTRYDRFLVANTTAAPSLFPASPYESGDGHDGINTTWTWVSFLAERKPIVVNEVSETLYGVTLTVKRQYDPNPGYVVQLSPNPQYSATLETYGKDIRPPTSTEQTSYGIVSLSPPKVEECASLSACLANLKRAVDTLTEEDSQPAPANAPKSETAKNLLAQHRVNVLCGFAAWKIGVAVLGWKIGDGLAESRDAVAEAFALKWV